MRTRCTLIVALACLAGSLSAQDIAGAKDHPIITRYPGSVIRWFDEENHLTYTLPTGPVTGYRHVAETRDVEGRVTRIYYTLDGTTRTDDEVYRNYLAALTRGGFEILAEGYLAAGRRGVGVGSPSHREVLYRSNPFNDSRGAVNEMGRGSATSGGGGTIMARKARGTDTAYVVVSVYRFRDNRISTLVDVIEVAAAETGLVSVDAAAIRAGLAMDGRVVLDGLFFDTDAATLQPASAPTLAQMATFLRSVPNQRFFVVGHTDATGTFDHNRRLSTDRATTVVEALVRDHGIARTRLVPHGVGPLVPAATNDSDAGRARNRRVELVAQP
jgi:outer membrane protein OmpA-like peptidoglycan-associated protein